ncbi:MAG: hypothetical protein M1818_008025 [Claussenomyces sp. TS43310]|nr:MAG: hypothetical protein M1818_008025 [Claussenomyces sp. TS43310]
MKSAYEPLPIRSDMVARRGRPTSLPTGLWYGINATKTSNAQGWMYVRFTLDCELILTVIVKKLPLDWLEPSDDARAVIAIIRLPASDMRDYKGPVFTNPGGPGGSGVFALRDRGKLLQTIVGRNHDIISFDPRGVGVSTPRIECWPSVQSKKIWALQHAGVADSHPGVLYDAFARSSAHSQACALSMGNARSVEQASANNSNDTVAGAEPLKYVSTVSVARDMLEIMEKTGQEKLKYWGFSYGTILGGVFAAMWPEKIERLVSDGNVDYSEWFTDAHATFLQDADKVMATFYNLCHLSGPDKCAFYAASPSAIEARLDALLERLKKYPIIVPGPLHALDLPEIIYYSSLKRMISAALYRPVHMFPALAKVLAALEAGDGRPFLDLNEAEGFWEPFRYDCNSGDMPVQPPETEEGNDEIFKAVLCTDGGRTNESIANLEEYLEALIRQSKASGAVNLNFRISCAGWTVRPKWMFKGPFTGNTSFPILYIANEADNVTPLRSARNNAKGFPNSTLLIQESYGADMMPFQNSLDASATASDIVSDTSGDIRSAVWELSRQKQHMWKPLYTY